MALNNNYKSKRKMIKAHKPPPQQENSTDEDSYVPLAAKDSGWVDLQFHDANKANYNQMNGDADDEITIELYDEETRQQSPIAMLFPNLSDADLSQKTSPTDITKMLVGQKPNTKYLKSCKKTYFLQDLPPLVEAQSDTFSECTKSND